MPKPTASEPTADEIATAILEMFNTLVLIDGLPETPFTENVRGAIAKFDKPKLRTSLSRRLFHPERYTTSRK